MRATLLALGLASVLAGCAGCGTEATPTERPAEPATTASAETATQEETTTAEKKPQALPGLPAFVAGYGEWTKLNAKALPPRDSDPHLGTKNVFASRTPGANGLFPNGTTVVKEGVRPGKDFIGLIATMRKRKSADPAHNDWIFVEYAREAAGDPFRELARGAVCYGCHVGAAESDYVWTAAR
jgi:hypothetical protein